MICPRCQRYMKQVVERCPVCGYVLNGGISTAAPEHPIPPDEASTAGHAPAAPVLSPAPSSSGRSPIDVSVPSGQPSYAPTAARSAMAGGSTIAATPRYALPPGLIEGEIIDKSAPTYEPRDANRTAAFLAALVMIEAVVVALLISAYLAIFAVIVVILATFLFGPLAGAAGGCALNAIRLPFRAIAVIWRPVRGAFGPGPQRPVHEYIIRTIDSAETTFWIKGVVLPRDIEAGEYVRVAVALRNGRRYAWQGQRRDQATGVWTPLRTEQAPSSVPWLMALAALSGLLLYVLGAFGGR